MDVKHVPSGKRSHNYGWLMGKSTISMAMFNSELFVYQRVYIYIYTYIYNNIDKRDIKPINVDNDR